MQTLRLYFGITRDSLLSFSKLFIIHQLTVKEVRRDNDDVMTFICTSNRKLDYKPGQYGIWSLKQFVKGKPGRLFTVASPPSEGVVQVSTRIGRTDFKQKLSHLTVGSKMQMVGPIGEFTLPKQLPSEIVFVAGGIGITPIRALSKHIHDARLPVTTTLIHSANDFYLYRDELQGYVNESHFVSRDTFDTSLSNTATAQPTATYYISGPPAFVDAAHTLLSNKKIQNIKTDGFLGY